MPFNRYRAGWGNRTVRNTIAPVGNTRHTDSVIESRLDTILSKCVDRDKEFLNSLKSFFVRSKFLTDAQYNALVKAEARYSDAAVAERGAWLNGYSVDQRRKARLAAEYYTNNPPFFAELAKRILTDSDFIPSEKQYKALTENKYAVKAIAAAEAAPLFAVGDTVVIRSVSKKISLRGSIGFVIQPDAATVRHAAKGSKIYMILLPGSPEPVLCEERELRKVRKNGK